MLLDVERTSAAGLSLNRITSDDEFDGLRDDWNRLAGELPFRRWEWLNSWWRCYRQSGDKLCLLSVTDETDTLIGLAPWYIERSSLQGRVIRFLGSGRVMSDYLSILSAPGRESDVCCCIVEWVIEQSNSVWDAIDLEGVAGDDAPLTWLIDRLAGEGFAVVETPGQSCWQVSLPETWDEYLKRLSKTRRERVRQLGRRKFDTGEAVLHRVRDASELDRGFEILIDLHQQRREGLGERGCFSSDRFTQFLRLAAEEFLQRDRLRLQWVELGGKPVAVEIDFAGGDTVYYYQSGIDPNLPRERPGWLGVASALKLAVEEGFSTFDFLRGDEPYKAHWRGEPIPTKDVRIAAGTATAQLRHRLWCKQREMKNWLKGVLGSKRA